VGGGEDGRMIGWKDGRVKQIGQLECRKFRNIFRGDDIRSEKKCLRQISRTSLST